MVMNNLVYSGMLGYGSFILYPYFFGLAITPVSMVLGIVLILLAIGFLLYENRGLFNVFKRVKNPFKKTETTIFRRTKTDMDKDREALDYLIRRSIECKREDVRNCLLGVNEDFVKIWYNIEDEI